MTSHVFNNKFEKHHNSRATLIDINGRQGLTLLYEIDPDLQQQSGMPSIPDKTDNNLGVNMDWMPVVLNINRLEKST
jgi:hypothetical protein